MADVSKIKLPNGTTYDIKDDNALPLTGGSVTGPVSFGDTVTIDEATVGDLVVNGSASFTNNIATNQLNGVATGNTIEYIVGTQTASTNAWTGVTKDSALYDGKMILYVLPYAGTSSAATLNLTLSTGSTTGAKHIYRYGSTTAITTHFSALSRILLIYDATNGRWNSSAYYDSNSDNTYLLYYNNQTAGSGGIMMYSLFMQTGTIGRWSSFTTTSGTGTSKTKNAIGFRLGKLLYVQRSSNVAEGSSLANGTVYESRQLVDIRYSSNLGSTLTAKKPVYIVGTINSSDGLFYLADTWVTQTLPSSADGKVYIYVGTAYDTYRVDLDAYNPIYIYTNGQVREYVQDAGTVNGLTVQTAVPANAKFTDTTYSAGTGLSLSGTTFNHSNSISASTVGTSSATSGSTLAVPYVTYDAQGHITATGTHTHTVSGFLTSSSTLDASKLSGAIPSAVTATTQASTDNSTKIATTAYVTTAIANLPEPMVFKGSVGTGGTITSLPTAAVANEGHTYKVITALSSPSAKVGDTVISNGSEWIVIPSGDEPSGTVTSVGVSNATNGGLTVSGSPVTSSGTITIGHSNVLSSAQTTQAVYPIKIDKNGHISAYGSAVTIPTVPSATGSSTTGISIAAHGTGTVIGVQSTTTTASKVTVGSSSTDYGVKSAGNASTWTFEEKTIPNVTAAGSGNASLTFTMDTTDTKKLKITFSHTHTAPTIGTAITVQSKSGGSNGTAPTLGSKVPTVSASDVTVPIKNTSASTFVTGTTHTITDNGHTHTI